MNLRMLDGEIIKIKEDSKLQCPLDHYDLFDQPPEFIADVLEGVAKELNSETLLILSYLALQERLNLSESWILIKFALHDVLRRTAPEEKREIIYRYSTEQLIKSIVIFVENYYE